MTCEPILQVEHVDLSFRNRHLFRRTRFDVLRDICFELFRGETLGVIGRNGSGKSTLLRLVAGVYQPDAGRIRHLSRNTSLLSLGLGFDPNLSGRDNAIICGMLLGRSKAEVVAKLDEIIEFSELQHFIDQPIRTYSSGMRTRLGFSVAVTVQTDLLLIDEVLGVGDARFRRKAVSVMREKLRGDKSVMFVSHAERQVRTLCDRALWLEKGQLMDIGPTDAVFDRYQAYLDESEGLTV